MLTCSYCGEEFHPVEAESHQACELGHYLQEERGASEALAEENAAAQRENSRKLKVELALVGTFQDHEIDALYEAFKIFNGEDND